MKIDKDLVDYLMNNAISNLKRAKFNHDIVEDYYVPAMDFNKVELLKDEIINVLLINYKYILVRKLHFIRYFQFSIN